VTEPRATLIATIALAWREAVARAVGDSKQLSILYSGGLDSSLVAVTSCALAKVELVTIGVRGSADLRAGEEGARILGLPWTTRVVVHADVERILDSEGKSLASLSSVSQAVQAGLALAQEAASQTRVLCGQGADELFLGYAHFEGLTPLDAMKKRQEDLDRLSKEEWPLSVAIGNRLGKRLASPYLDPEFMRDVLALSIDELRSGDGRKPLLRQVAAFLGLPPEIARRPKKAFQYGSGIEHLVKQRTRGD
jgi:asparagine synthase (glutamine-hydrolysing)